MKKETNETKLKYGLWKNAGFMIASAFRTKEPMVFILCILLALLAVLQNLIGLFISPAIIDAVERHVSVTELVLTILFFVGATMLVSALSTYLSTNTLYGRVSVRTYLFSLVMIKNLRTSYQNLEDDKFRKATGNSSVPMCSNSASGEAFWGTLTGFMQNVLVRPDRALCKAV